MTSTIGASAAVASSCAAAAGCMSASAEPKAFERTTDDDVAGL